MVEIQNLSKQIHINYLISCFKDESAPKIIVGFKGHLGFYKTIKEGNIIPNKAEKKEKEFKSEINKIVKRGKKSEYQKSAINNIKTLYKPWEKLSNCLMIILELYLKVNAKQKMEKLSKILTS